MLPLQEYRDIAKEHKGTPICYAMIGLINEVEHLKRYVGVLEKRIKAVPDLEVNKSSGFGFNDDEVRYGMITFPPKKEKKS